MSCSRVQYPRGQLKQPFLWSEMKDQHTAGEALAACFRIFRILDLTIGHSVKTTILF